MFVRGRRRGNFLLRASIRTLVIKVTIFDFMLLPSLGAPKVGSVDEGLVVDQPTEGRVVSLVLYGRGALEEVEMLEWWRTRTAC